MGLPRGANIEGGWANPGERGGLLLAPGVGLDLGLGLGLDLHLLGSGFGLG